MPRSAASYAQRAAYMREVRRRYRAAGLCQYCGMVDVEQYSRCTKCRRRFAKDSLRWYRKHRTPAFKAAQRLKTQRWRQKAA